MKGRRMEKYHHRHQIDFSKDKKEKSIWVANVIFIVSQRTGRYIEFPDPTVTSDDLS